MGMRIRASGRLSAASVAMRSLLPARSSLAPATFVLVPVAMVLLPATSFLVPTPAGPGMLVAQERPSDPEGEVGTCFCAFQSEAEDERCLCIPHPDPESWERMQEAFETAREAGARIREREPEIRERILEAQERVRSHLDTLRVREAIMRLDLDTLRMGRFGERAVQLGIRLNPEPLDDHPGGVAVTGIARRSGAEEAGLREGDIVLELDGHDLGRPLPDEELDARASPAAQRLQALVRQLEEGDTVRVVYLRDGQRRTASVEARRLSPLRRIVAWSTPPGAMHDTILVWPRMPPIEIHPPYISTFPSGRMLGLSLMDLNPELGAYFGRDEGVLVLEVAEDAPLPFRAGDVILRIDGRQVRDSRHASEILRSYRSGEEIRVEVLRRGERVPVEGRVR
jgi:hypothetical protein